MSGAEAHPPPPPPPPHGAPHGYHPNPMQGEWMQWTRSPNGQHYYTYVHKYRRCGGRWGTGFVVGGLTGILAASWWQRRHANPDAACWGACGPWGACKKDGQNHQNQQEKKTEDISNQ